MSTVEDTFVDVVVCHCCSGSGYHEGGPMADDEECATCNGKGVWQIRRPLIPTASFNDAPDEPEFEAACEAYFGKIFDEPLRHFDVDSYSDMTTLDVTNEIQKYAAIGDTNEAYFDDRETFNIFETDS